MEKSEKVKILRSIQSGTVVIKEILPTKYRIVYPGKPFPKPIFLLDGMGVKAGKFFSRVLNDDTVSITV